MWAGLYFLLFACWGSFLNVVAFRTVFDRPFFTKRSMCNFCKKIIAWYDNIPILSWFLLRGKCRNCKKPISFLYPFIEFFTAVLMTFLFFYASNIGSFFAYFVFFSALIVATRTDLEALVIPQIFSLWLVPLGFIFAYFNFLDITFLQSFIGAVFGYGVLWVIAKLFLFVTKKEGLGIGDMELLALIGAFTGPLGIWISLLVGSFAGLFLAGGYILILKKSLKTRIPFGPFLVVGAVVYFFFKNYFISFLLTPH